MTKGFKTTVAIFLLLLLGAGGLYFWNANKNQTPQRSISTFEECAEAGYPIMEIYPEQCRTPDGRMFVRDITATTTPSGEATSTEGEDGGADQPVACTADAMLCSDGSYVGRTGPKCQFVCPPIVSSGVFGQVFVGPICPVERIPPDPNCAARPLQTDLALTTYDGSKIVKLFSSDADGQFRISAAPGSYVIRPAPGAPSLPSCYKNEIIVVKANSYTESTVYCDSGIR